MMPREPLLSVVEAACGAGAGMGDGGGMIVKGEALIRLEAERRLLSAYRGEYDRLLKRGDHVRAVRSLVKSHKRAYDSAVREARDWALVMRAQLGATRAA